MILLNGQGACGKKRLSFVALFYSSPSFAQLAILPEPSAWFIHSIKNDRRQICAKFSLQSIVEQRCPPMPRANSRARGKEGVSGGNGVEGGAMVGKTRGQLAGEPQGTVKLTEKELSPIAADMAVGEIGNDATRAQILEKERVHQCSSPAIRLLSQVLIRLSNQSMKYAG